MDIFVILKYSSLIISILGLVPSGRLVHTFLKNKPDYEDGRKLVYYAMLFTFMTMFSYFFLTAIVYFVTFFPVEHADINNMARVRTFIASVSIFSIVLFYDRRNAK